MIPNMCNEVRLRRAFAAASTLVASACLADVRHVDDDARPGGDGSSWISAYDDLQLALAVAQPGDEIRIAQGLYHPAPPGNNRTASFHLLAGVIIQGGYAGLGAPDPDARDIKAFPSVLSGDLNGNDGSGPGGNAENSFRVVSAYDIDATAVLDGVRIVAGHANDPDHDAENGAGAYIFFGSPTFINCSFESNSATKTGGGVYSIDGSPSFMGCAWIENSASVAGGGVYLASGSLQITDGAASSNNSAKGGAIYLASGSLLIGNLDCTSNTAQQGGAIYAAAGLLWVDDSTFSSNQAADGGAVYSLAVSSFTGCALVENSSSVAGGGAYLAWGSLQIIDSTASSNDSTQGGAIYVASGSLVVQHLTCLSGMAHHGGAIYAAGGSLSIRDSTFALNHAAEGGAVYHSDATGTLEPPLYANCRFSSNAADPAAYTGGGAMFNYVAAPIMVNCFFAGNQASGLGGAVFNYASIGGMYHNCAFTGNFASVIGGTMYSDYTHSEFFNCTIAANSAGLVGGIVSGEGSSTFLVNSILWGNTDNAIQPDELTQLVADPAGNVSIDHCCIEGFTGEYYQDPESFDADPLFPDLPGPDGIVGTLDDNLRLAPDSPCLNAADPLALPADVGDLDEDADVQEPLPLDLDMHARTLGPAPELGPYERPKLGDVNFDDVVNIHDLLALIGAWGPCPPTPAPCPADFNADGQVNIIDLLTVIANWG
ncbi:MAG: dockerin type I domain-containing protein [Phycisphaerales bacterium]|nr:dockerin type I domain-containing protein [Phycisphaerales bacterium]MCI0675085.1 dockerin type I domain-containing protein [Phycisphaerales bacterium]